MVTLYFQPIPRWHRAKGLVPAIRHCSTRFKRAVAAGDDVKIELVSQQAWDLMTKLFEILRGEQDAGHLAAAPMNAATALIINRVSITEQQKMLSLKKIDRTRSTTLGLRDALNKIAHYKKATFRVDKRNAHYLLLAGTYNGKPWIVEILVSRLCSNSAAAIKAITG